MGDAMGIKAPVEEGEGDGQVTSGGLVGGQNSQKNGQKNGQNNGKNGENEDDEDNMDVNVNYKDGSSFAKAMKGKQNEAQSQFAKSKTMTEQREYLPVFAVKEELLNIIRENQITVIVGETGSGQYYT